MSARAGFVVAEWSGKEPVGFSPRPSPSPRPAPAGRGSDARRFLPIWTPKHFERWLQFSLAQRERAGVRENGSHALDPHTLAYSRLYSCHPCHPRANSSPP